MDAIKAMWSELVRKHKMMRLKKAVETVEAAGMVCCNIQQRAGSFYLVDGQGAYHRIGRR